VKVIELTKFYGSIISHHLGEERRNRDASWTDFLESKMEPKILEEIRSHFKHEVIEFDWEPIRKQPRRYGILYPIVGYIVSLIAFIFMGLGVFMWLFLIGGAILCFGGMFCGMEIIDEYKKIKIQKEVEHGSHC
jgi:hypothetical protein